MTIWMLSMILIQTMCLPKIRTDGGTEFMSSSFERTVHQHGCGHETTDADASSQNGLVERPHRTLKERMRCLLYSVRLGTRP